MSINTVQFDKFEPVLSFMAVSDIHIDFKDDEPCRRTRDAVELSYELTGGKLHAAVFIGDTANSGKKEQFEAFRDVMKESLCDGTRLLALTAKSHDGNEMGKAAIDFFEELTGIPGDMHTVINGFHFITLSTSREENVYYSEYQRQWLKEQLEEAVGDDPLKPVFVFHHEHVKYTVYGSFDEDGWGNDYFREILNGYPQIVHLSGHSHYPVNDPRSIWQGEFTAVGTGALKYLEFTVDGERKIHPDGYGDEAELWLVECDKNNAVRLRAYDVIEKKLLCQYLMESPFSRELTPEKMKAKSKPPVFSDCKIKTKKAEGALSVTFGRAESTDGMPVFLYRIYVLDGNGNEIKETKSLPDYYSATLRDEWSVIIRDVPSDAKKVKITAETAFGIKSDPVFAEISL